MKRIATLALLTPTPALAACGKPSSIECPAAQLPANGAPADTSADIRSFGELFLQGCSGNTLPQAIRSVREKEPTASNSDVRNFLIAAYCPVARETAVGADTQQAAMQQLESALGDNLTP